MLYKIITILLISFSYADLLQPISNAMLNYTHVLFEWEQEPTAVSYNFQLSTDQEFANIIVEHNESTTIYIEKNVLDWENTYYWRIQPVFFDETLGEFSDINIFSTKEEKFDVSIDMIHEQMLQNGLTAFCHWGSFESVAFDKFGREVWNDGDLYLIFTVINDFGEIFGHIDTQSDEGPLRATENNFKEEVLWDEPDGWPLDIHEIIQLPNGNYMGIYNTTLDGPIPFNSWTPLFQAVGYIADGITSEFPWLAPTLVEFDKDTKEIVWTWDYFDYYNMNDYSLGQWYNAMDLGYYDWIHLNSIFFDEIESEIYLSFRHISRISKISYPSGELIWNMGYLSNDNSSICSDLGFSFQHHLQLLGDGSLLFFDNGNISPILLGDQNPITRIRRVEVINNSYCNEEWEYALPEDLFTQGMGSVQLLDNNNYLINSIANNGTILEITEEKEEIWRANLNAESPKNYRAFRIPGIHPDAFSVIFNHLNYNNNLETIISNYLSIDIFNKSEYNQPYVYILNDSNNCFNSISDTINLDSNNDTTLTFDYNCNNLNETQINFTIKPEYHEYAEKNYSINFMYENFDINNDNVINIIDIIEIINCIINNSDCISYDINYDNQINILDIMILVNIITN